MYSQLRNLLTHDPSLTIQGNITHSPLWTLPRLRRHRHIRERRPTKKIHMTMRIHLRWHSSFMSWRLRKCGSWSSLSHKAFAALLKEFWKSFHNFHAEIGYAILAEHFLQRENTGDAVGHGILSSKNALFEVLHMLRRFF